jgi:hypothetical protein
MISIITYGRNDDRGYGMAKRVAIGLNVLALQVDSGSGEILFVDYNTPDHLPTLPELIWDSLTRQTRRRLRVLRVRPTNHARFAHKTPLPVIESVARNTALRRSNPANRWILSTNTDAMIVSRGVDTLIAAAESLEPGQYGLPRFELPERAWEGFVRTDPHGCLALADEWAREARLREIVRGVPDVAFDNPGDFQLIPRADLIALGGFEEEMLLAWHVDHNIAKRLAVRLGSIRSLEDRFELFHLGHARNVVATHGSDRAENDVNLFVERIDRPEALHSTNSWGLRDEEIEEIRLEVAPGEIVRAACRAVMPPLEKPPVTLYTPESFDNIGYDAGRAAAHLLDLLSTYHRQTVVAYAGLRRDTFKLVLRGLAALGFRRRVLIPASVANQLGAEQLAEVQIADDPAALATADVMVFEFGHIWDEESEQGRAPEEDRANIDVVSLERIATLAEQAEALEHRRLALGTDPRLFVFINLVHSRYERRLSGLFATSASPFSTRLRYGPVLNAYGSESADRRHSHKPFAEAYTLLQMLARDQNIEVRERFEVAAHREAIELLLQDRKVLAAMGPWEAQIRARLAACTEPFSELSERSLPNVYGSLKLSGLARRDSWENARWASEASRVSPVRNGWTWERAQILFALDSLSHSLPQGPILVLQEHDEILIDLLSNRFGQVDVLDIHQLEEDDRELAPPPAGALPRGVRRIDPGTLSVEQYAIIVAPHASAFRYGLHGLARILAQLRAALAPRGVLIIGGEVALLGPEVAMRPTLAAAAPAGFPELCAQLLDLRLEDGGEWGLRPGDLALVGNESDLELGHPVLGIARESDVLWPAVWVLRTEGKTLDIDKGALSSAFLDLALGEQCHALRLGAGARREDGAIVAGPLEGHVAYGPFLRLAFGTYQAGFTLSAPIARPNAPLTRRIVCEVSLGDDIVAQETLAIELQSPAPAQMRLDFAVGEDARPCELRVWSDGYSDFCVESVKLSRLEHESR